MNTSIILYPDERLTTLCEPVTSFGKPLEEKVALLKKVLSGEEKGMGMAANQIGIMERFFIMGNQVIVNPVIEEFEERDNDPIEEGCLSTPGVYAKVLGRAHLISVRFMDASQKRHNMVYRGLHAVCFQHELDHLDGIFWFERLSNTQKRRVRKINKRWSKVKF